MRVVVDYGLTPHPISRTPAPTVAGAGDTRREPVVVIDLGRESGRGKPGDRAGSLHDAAVPAAGANRRAEDGIPVPGTPYALVASEEAAARDREVRSHERSHLLALGPYAASGISYSTVRGPDGQSYAVGGSIKADLTEVPGDPQATLRKANAVRRAALAPGDPSSADMQVAARAYRLARDAREEIEAQRLDTSG